MSAADLPGFDAADPTTWHPANGTVVGVLQAESAELGIRLGANLAPTAERIARALRPPAADLIAEVRRADQPSADRVRERLVSGIRGFHFRQGPEVTRPIPFDWTMSWPKVDEARHAWARAIDEAARYEDAWGILCTRPDGDVTLRDCLTPGATWEATRASAVHLLLAREAR